MLPPRFKFPPNRYDTLELISERLTMWACKSLLGEMKKEFSWLYNMLMNNWRVQVLPRMIVDGKPKDLGQDGNGCFSLNVNFCYKTTSALIIWDNEFNMNSFLKKFIWYWISFQLNVGGTCDELMLKLSTTCMICRISNSSSLQVYFIIYY